MHFVFATQHYTQHPSSVRRFSPSGLPDKVLIPYLKITRTRTSASNVRATAGARRQLTNAAALRSTAFLRRATLLIPLAQSPPCQDPDPEIACTYLNSTRTRTRPRNELARTRIIRIHTKPAPGTRTAGFSHAAFHVGGITGAIAC